MTTIRAKVPPKVKERIFGKVVELADSHGYLRQKRPANGRFIESLVANPEIGGKLVEYLDKIRVKSYVSDCLIKDYVRQKKPAAADPETVIPETFKGAVFVEQRRGISKFAFSGSWILATCCTFKHWEIGVKKLALAASQFRADVKAPKMLLLVHMEGHTNTGDKKQMESAIKLLGFDAVWF